MCLLIAQCVGASMIPDSHIECAWNENPDGAGFAYVDNGKLIVKRYAKLRKFRKAYAQAHAAFGMSSPFIVHFRYATHGGVSAANTHPFIISDGRVAFAHNGMLPNADSPHKSESDTRYFARTVLAHRTPDQLLSEEFGAFLSTIIGKGNKFALLSDSGTLSIVNESEGEWIGTNWYSNQSYRPAPKFPLLKYPSRSLWDWAGRDIRDDWEDEYTSAIDCKLTESEAYAIGFDAATNPSARIDADELTEDQWRAYRNGLSDGLAESYGRDISECMCEDTILRITEGDEQ
ncbi:MAG: class II glutamine amidotransferase [Phycisphaerales bacterium]|nr:class II glutamine amidotransferase [Phycisphaerales bacterium]